ncbi:MAG TPA: NAD-dependent epimerase/dehydratase family protein [Candidatus Dormibacteraeota bacterium]|nr:NAD-dependent epimerase/dehydratase family protein [Candidatus Dormibacteraeota bacterium]
MTPPGPVLLTGATGFVGRAVLGALRERGYAVRALVRDPRRLPAAPGLAVVGGGLLDPAAVLAAARGCAAAIHCAADYRLALRPVDVEPMIATNVGGTATVLAAARQAGLGRVVHCSTVGVLAFTAAGRVCDEADVAPDPGRLAGPYKRSKWAAERLALAAAGPDLEVVVVNPSTPLGAGDGRPTPTGRVIADFLQGRIPATVATGLNVVDVEAVGRGHVDALERGLSGRCYILGDRNCTLAELLGSVAAAAGRRPPRWRLPYAVALAAAWASEGRARWGAVPPGIPLTSVRMARHPMYVDAARARTELGWDPGDLAGAVAAAVRWFDGGPARVGT